MVTGWWRARNAAAPRVPDGERIYAIGDIHGRLDLLTRMIDLIDAETAQLPPATTLIILLGDLIDRGPHSRQVVDLVMRRRGDRAPVVLKGNHEDTAVAAWLGDNEALEGWLRHGGVATLESYGVSAAEIAGLALEDAQRLLHETIPTQVIAFFSRLPLYYVRGDYVFVHAGLRPGIPLDRQEDADMMWIRDEFLGYRRSHGPVVVHGHTVTDAVDVRRNRIGVDTGAYRTGRLSAIRLFEDRQDVVSVESEGEGEMLLDDPL